MTMLFVSAKRWSSALLVVVFGLPVSALVQQTPAQAPTLADIARQKRAEKAKKVYTDEDMKAAEPMVATTDGVEAPKTADAPVKNNEAIAAAEAKLEDLKKHEAFYIRNIARFENSAKEATEAGDEGKLRIMTESVESARAELAKTAEDRAKAEKDLEEIKAAAAAAAAAPKKRPARKPAATTPKT
jgi:hypothetical protein